MYTYVHIYIHIYKYVYIYLRNIYTGIYIQMYIHAAKSHTHRAVFGGKSSIDHSIQEHI